MKDKKRLRSLSLSAKLSLLRGGHLTPWEIAKVATEFGTDNFVEAKPDVEQLLDHPNEIVRYNSMSSLAFEWGGTDRPDRFIEIALHDPDSDCRRIAAGALGSLFRGTNDVHVADILARIALKEHEEELVRFSAYIGLLDVLGQPRSAQPDPVSLTLKDFNWELVRKYHVKT
jgi:hypothetical protein